MLRSVFKPVDEIADRSVVPMMQRRADCGGGIDTRSINRQRRITVKPAMAADIVVIAGLCILGGRLHGCGRPPSSRSHRVHRLHIDGGRQWPHQLSF